MTEILDVAFEAPVRKPRNVTLRGLANRGRLGSGASEDEDEEEGRLRPFFILGDSHGRHEEPERRNSCRGRLPDKLTNG